MTTTLEEEKGIALDIIESTNSIENIFISNATYENFHLICRFCLTHEDIKSFLDMTYRDMPIRNVILDGISLQVDSEDSLPKHLCTGCLSELIRCYNFRVRCLEVEKILIGAYNNRNHNRIKLETDEDNQNIHIKNEDTLDESSANIKEDDVIGDSGNFSDTSSLDLESKRNTKKLVRRKKTSKFRGNKSQGPPFKCKDCQECYDTRELLQSHRKVAKHSEQRNHSCSICKKCFTRSKLKQHMRVHTKEKPYVCKICSQAFSMSGNLKRHMMTHTGERPYVCEVCGKGFIQSKTLQIHRRTHSPITYDSLEFCTSEAHITCEFCGRGFKRAGGYKNHLRKHLPETETGAKRMESTPQNGKTSGEHSCDICKRLFKTKHLLKAHKLTHGEKSYLCSECGKVFTTKGSLQSHLKVHTGEKPHTCTVCKKSFGHVGSFEAHMLIHTGKRPYSCPVCAKSFTQLAHLKYHSRIHSGEKPFSCNYCDKKFSLKGNLTVHIRIHTGETPYLCPMCGKGFYDSSSMKRHCKGHGDVFVPKNEVDIVKTDAEEKYQTIQAEALE
ncbi:hypothetical protein Trydic_g17379 [Trypoxylus dichotomus]